MARASSFPLSLPVAVLAGMLSACGQSGRLYHPDEPAPHSQRGDTLGMGTRPDAVGGTSGSGTEAPAANGGGGGELKPEGSPAGADAPQPSTPPKRDAAPERKNATPATTP